jgi:hypothetical protein
MSPSALLEDRAPSCMLYSMVECRAWGSRTHPWPCRAMPGNSVQRRCAPRREGKVKGLGGHSPTELPQGLWELTSLQEEFDKLCSSMVKIGSEIRVGLGRKPLDKPVNTATRFNSEGSPICCRKSAYWDITQTLQQCN